MYINKFWGRLCRPRIQARLPKGGNNGIKIEEKLLSFISVLAGGEKN